MTFPQLIQSFAYQKTRSHDTIAAPCSFYVLLFFFRLFFFLLVLFQNIRNKVQKDQHNQYSTYRSNSKWCSSIHGYVAKVRNIKCIHANDLVKWYRWCVFCIVRVSFGRDCLIRCIDRRNTVCGDCSLGKMRCISSCAFIYRINFVQFLFWIQFSHSNCTYIHNLPEIFKPEFHWTY